MVHTKAVAKHPPERVHHAVVVEQVAELLAPFQKPRRRVARQLGRAATEPGLFRGETWRRKSQLVDQAVQPRHLVAAKHVLQDQVSVQIEKVFLDRVVVQLDGSSELVNCPAAYFPAGPGAC